MSGGRKSGKRGGIFLPPGEGRSSPTGLISAVFKVNGDATERAYSISEWWLEPRTRGPGVHTHEEDDVFYVLEGTVTFLIGERCIDAPEGSFVLAPRGVAHDFENRGATRAGVLNFSVPGGMSP